MILNQQAGPVSTTSSIGVGTQVPLRAGNLGDTIFSELHGRYYETCYRRGLFGGATQVGQTTTVGAALTYVGICLSNPIGSPVNLVLNKVGFSFLVAFAAAASIGLMTGYNSGTNVTHTTALVPKSLFTGVGALPIGTIDSSSTLPTAPTFTHIFGTGLTGAITTVPAIAPTIIDLEGGVILPPGAYAATFTSTASGAASFWGSMQWEEVPV